MNNIAGQITHPNSGEVTPGEYVAGWAKRGPPGPPRVKVCAVPKMMEIIRRGLE